MLRCHVSRRLSDRLDGVVPRSRGLRRQAPDDPGASRRSATPPSRSAASTPAGRRHLAQGVSLQPGPERHGRDVADPTQSDRQPNPGDAHVMSHYDLPDEILVEADGPIRVVTLNRPDDLNATNHVLHSGLGRAVPPARRRRPRRGWPSSRAPDAPSPPAVTSTTSTSSPRTPRCASMTLTARPADRHRDGRCRLPIVAAVNGPAVGLGCTLVALSDIVYMAESAHLADPHVALGLVAADGGTGGVAAAHQPAAGQGVRADGGTDPGASGRPRSAWSTTCAPTTR